MYTFKPIIRDLTVDSLMWVINAIRPKNYFFNGEIHDFWELVYVKEGHAIATGDDRIYNLYPGHLLFHKPLEFHSIKTPDDSSAHVIIISFKASGMLMKKLENKLLLLTSDEQDLYKKVSQLIKRAIVSYLHDKGDTEDYKVASTKAAVALEDMLMRFIEKDDAASPNNSISQQLYSKIISVMSLHCEENFSVEDIARECKMSTSNMKRIFKMYSDKGVAKSFLSLKIRRACELISSGYSTAQIAERLGFSSAAYFHTVFKREMDISPANFRKTKDL